MSLESLGDFLAVLQEAGELVRVAQPVSLDQELSVLALQAATLPQGGPVLFFQQPGEKSIPVVVNLFSSLSRIQRAVRCPDENGLFHRLTDLIAPPIPNGFWETLKAAPDAARQARWTPRLVKVAACQQVVRFGRDVNLRDLPIPRHWPGEAGGVLWGSLVWTKAQGEEARLSSPPIQILDQHRIAIRWSRRDPNWAIWQQAREARRQMPVAISLGGDPVWPLVAALPTELAPTPWQLGGWLRSEGVDVVRCRSHELEVPASSEFVLEGAIDSEAQLEEVPPIALPSGDYSRQNRALILPITAITHRSNPVLPLQIPGRFGASPANAATSFPDGLAPAAQRPHLSGEFEVLAEATARLVRPLLKRAIPELVDYYTPADSGRGRTAIVSLHKTTPFQARRLMYALFGQSLLERTKFMILVDADVPVRDAAAVWRAISLHVDLGRDEITCDSPLDEWDFSQNRPELGVRRGIDATRKMDQELASGSAATPMTRTPTEWSQLTSRWSDFGLPQRPS